jgi:hypothetical protein
LTTTLRFLKFKLQMTNIKSTSNDKTSKRNNFDLEERTAVFGERIIHFCKGLKYNEISKPIINQLIRSTTSIGANYMEANGADSNRVSLWRLNFLMQLGFSYSSINREQSFFVLALLLLTT